MAHFIRYAGICFRGSVRKKNEDNILCADQYLPPVHADMEHAFTGTVDSVTKPVFAVADGLGGYEEGETASYLAVKVLADHNGIGMKDRCIHINKKICRYAEKKRIYGTGTTLAAIQFHNTEFKTINLGDSRVYMYRDGILKQLSKDDVPGYAMPGGAVSQYLGIPEEMLQLEYHESQCQALPGDQFLICSDGLTKMLGDQRLSAILGEKDYTEEEKIFKLKKTVENRGAVDNTSIIICRVE